MKKHITPCILHDYEPLVAEQPPARALPNQTITKGTSAIGWPAIECLIRNHFLSWKCYEKGTAHIEFELSPKGQLCIAASENPAQWRGRKEVHLKLEKESVDALRNLLDAFKSR